LRSGPDALVDAVPEASCLDRTACRAAIEWRFCAARMAAERAAPFERGLVAPLRIA
jgi:hypothetical protein